MQSTLRNISIRGVATAIPSGIVDLHELEASFGSQEVERIIKATGIHRVRVAEPGLCASDLCEAAARVLLARLDLAPGQIDGLVFVSQTPDYILPATSALLQDRLGLPKTVSAFDLNYGCSGYVYGLLQAAMLIAAGGCTNVLLCAGDVITPYIAATDRANRMVFGDAGSATIVSAGSGELRFDTYTDGGGATNLLVPAGGARIPRSAETSTPLPCPGGYLRSHENLHMHGMNIFNFAINVVPDFVRKLVAQAGWTMKDLEFLGLHQANRFLVGNLRRMLQLSQEVAPFECADVGNTGPASIPLLLTLRYGERPAICAPHRSILCGFGAGYSAAGVCLSLADTLFIPPLIAHAPDPLRRLPSLL